MAHPVALRAFACLQTQTHLNPDRPSTAPPRANSIGGWRYRGTPPLAKATGGPPIAAMAASARLYKPVQRRLDRCSGRGFAARGCLRDIPASARGQPVSLSVCQQGIALALPHWRREAQRSGARVQWICDLVGRQTGWVRKRLAGWLRRAVPLSASVWAMTPGTPGLCFSPAEAAPHQPVRHQDVQRSARFAE